MTNRAPFVIIAALTVVCAVACTPSHAGSGTGGQQHAIVVPAMSATPAGRQSQAAASAAATDTAPPAFHASVTRLGPAWQSRLRYTWHPDCPQPLSGLALIRMTYWGLDNSAHSGEMIVNATVVRKIIWVFSVLYRDRYPIHRMVLPDRYKGSDPRSTNADNTSAFNCRLVDGTNVWSMHAYGLAVDINPCENVYIDSGYIDPPRCRANADRSRHVPGLVHSGGLVVRTFAAIGWGWGGSWVAPKDYQHFSSNGH